MNGALAALMGACADEMQRRASTAGAWSPLTDPKTLEAWLVDAGVTEVDDAGTPRISAWVGQVAGEVLSQGTMADRPSRAASIDGRAVHTHDSGGQYLDVTWSTISPAPGDAVVSIGRYDGASGTTSVAYDGDTLRAGLRNSTGVLAYFAGGSIVTGSAVPSALFLSVVKYDGASSWMRNNDLSADDASGDGGSGYLSTGLVDGIHQNRASTPWVGKKADKLIVRGIDDAYLTNLVTWASARWPTLSLTAP